MSQIKEKTLSPWAWKAVIQSIDCPTCKSPQSFMCIEKTGVSRRFVHLDRATKYIESIGPKEFDRRHRNTYSYFLRRHLKK